MGVVNVGYSPEDMKTAAEGGFKNLPEGWYVARAIEKKHEAAKKEGSYPNFLVKVEILQSFNGENVGKKRWRRFNLSPKSTPYNLIPFLKAAGINYQDTGNGIVFDDDHVIGAVTKAEVKITKGDQRDFEDWDNDEPIPGVSAAPPAQSGFVQAPQNFALAGPPPPQGLPQQGFPPQQQWTPPGAPPPQSGFAPQMQPQAAPPGYAPQQAPAPMQAPPQGPQGYPPAQTYQQPAPGPQAAAPGQQMPGQGAPPPWMQQRGQGQG